VKRNWTKLAIALGPAIIIASVVWEFARTEIQKAVMIWLPVGIALLELVRHIFQKTTLPI